MDIVVPEDVIAEVRRKNAEVEFNSFKETVSDRYSDALSIRLRLLEDPDEEDRCWVVFEVKTSGISPETYSNELREFLDALFARRPHITSPICQLRLRSSSERS
jgi:hypothetical protein